MYYALFSLIFLGMKIAHHFFRDSENKNGMINVYIGEEKG